MVKPGKAPVWQHFKEDPSNEDRVLCTIEVGDKICGLSVIAKDGTTSNMHRHMRSLHEAENVVLKSKMLKLKPNKSLEDSAKRKAEEELPNANKRLKQNFFGENDAQLDKVISDAIVDFLADTGVAFRVMGRPSFIKLMQTANKRIKLKSPQTYSRMIKVKSEEILERMASIISAVRSAGDLKSVAFTTDIWTSRAQDPYMSLTVHFIDGNWNLHRWTPFVKPFPSSHTGKNISLELTEMLQVVIHIFHNFTFNQNLEHNRCVICGEYIFF